MRISGFSDISTVDWWGKLTTTIFFAGCNYRCMFCYNHKEIFPNSGKNMSMSEIYNRIEENEPLIDAVVCSGGEPCMQPIALYDILSSCKARGLETMLNTNGSYPKIVEELWQRDLIDKLAMDIKAPLAPVPYESITGTHNRMFDYIKVRDTLKKSSRIPTEIRTTVIPNTYADLEHTRHIINMIRLYPVEFHIQQFDSTDPLDDVLKGIEPYSFDEMYELGMYAKKVGIKTVLVKSRDRTEYVTED